MSCTGRPIGAPVSCWGRFVMNTNEGLQQAIVDDRSGRPVQPL